MNLADLERPARDFGSDVHAGAHPHVLAAITAANEGHAPGYGADELSVAVSNRLAVRAGMAGPVRFAFSGTGANVAVVRTLASSPGGLLFCTAGAHVAIDEEDGPAVLGDVELVIVPDQHGKIAETDLTDAVQAYASGIAHGRPAVLFVANATEAGTCYTPAELAGLAASAHAAGLKAALDGARITNALAATGATLADMCGRPGFDAVVLGGTKAGLVGGEAVLFAAEQPTAYRVFKQLGQVPSKTRFIAAQFSAWDSDMTLALAHHANEQASDLAIQLAALDVEILHPVDASAVFVRFPAPVAAVLADFSGAELWDASGEVLRFACSWDTTDEDVARLVAGVATALTFAR